MTKFWLLESEMERLLKMLLDNVSMKLSLPPLLSLVRR